MKNLITTGILVLIIVAIIGVLIINSISKKKNVTEQILTNSVEELSALEKEAFNSQFEGFKGDISGTLVKSLVAKVIASNTIYPDRTLEITTAEPNECVSLVSGATNATYGTEFANSKTYTVTLIYGTSSVVEKISVEKKQ